MWITPPYIKITILCCLFAISCGQKEAEMKRSGGNFSANGTVREITLFPDEPVFPDAEGKNLFISNCGICHSLRYTSMQPNFPRKTWEAVVNKMRTKYSASIDSAVAVKIVDYLVRVKGVN
jgi:mono/diheme cytochrome c family protein